MITVRMLRNVVVGPGWHPRTLMAGKYAVLSEHEATEWCLRGWAEPTSAPKIGSTFSPSIASPYSQSQAALAQCGR